MSRNRLIAVAMMIVLFLAIFGLATMRGKRKVTKSTAQVQKELGVPVQTSAVRMGDIRDTLPVTGDLKALLAVTLSSKASGKVVSVSAREGDRVRRGQVIIQLDQTDAQQSMRQALAGLESAQARLSQAETTASVTRVQSDAGIRQAQAGLSAAEANLQKIRKGARSQEVIVAENSVASAKANHDNAQANLKRYKQLYSQGAVAQAQLDVAQTQFDVALAQYNTAKQNLSLIEEGARSEDISQAETQVTQAREALRTARANAAQNAIRQEDINNAQAGVSQAQAQVALARQQIEDTLVRSPIDGYLAERTTEPGQTASPGVSLGQVVNLRSVYFEADVSETVLSKVAAGQTVDVRVDAYQNSSFIGKIVRVYPSASTGTRNFKVRVNIPNPDAKLRPGMFARGTIVAGGNTGAVIVPQTAIEERSGKRYVFVVDGNTARLREIRVGLSNDGMVEVLPPTDLSPSDVIVTSGHQYLEDGAKVNTRG